MKAFLKNAGYEALTWTIAILAVLALICLGFPDDHQDEVKL